MSLSPRAALLAVPIACAACGKRGAARNAPNDASRPATVASTMSGPQTPQPSSRDASFVTAPITLPDAPHRFQKLPLAPEQLASLVSAAPELARLGPDVTFFEPGDGTYLTRSRAAHEDFVFTSQPVVWTPKPGLRLLVLSGHGKESTFVGAWSEAPGGGLRLESAFVMLKEMAPVALGYRKDEPELWWTSCWMCPGETGKVTLRDDGHVVVVQD